MLSQEIKDRAFRILELRDHSAKELKNKLIQKGEDPDESEECVAWLEEIGVIDDERYAAAVVRRYVAKGYGAGRIRTEFGRRGIDRELWENAFEEMPDEKDALDKMVQAKMETLPDRKELKKFTDKLLRRGFSWDEINEALNRNRAEEGLRY